MHADALPPPHQREPGWGLPLALALLVHLLVALVFIVAWFWSPERNTDAAAGDPSVEASLALSASEASAARQALRQSEKLEDLPPPVAEPIPVPEDTIPPPQPIPEPRPQDAPTPQQQQAQERVAQPDTKDQEAVSALAISQEKAKQEQEAKRRQEQIDLTERKRQEEAEQKLRQVAAARNAAGSAAAGSSGASQPAAGGGGNSDDLSAKYAAAIQAKVLSQWVRPDTVPLGQRCQITITQIPGGTVMQAKVSPNCPYDEAGKRSIEAAVLNAQPLPYRGFESVFARTLNFTFTAQDR
ncbi:cell envelope integrity protein TolA [Stenotrophomonas maltophilia]|uniref:cell envelope integrity protein TolA n=1 Tax=Stenotrophomonas maltophilia TaxID=40324 RepID=UPI002553F3F4|nr:cell envelope integrity protein TolA [Stenotrophomonas maltophilia]